MEAKNLNLQKQLAEVQTQLAECNRRLAESEQKNEELEKKLDERQNFLLGELEKANQKSGRQQQQIKELNDKVADLERVNGTRTEPAPKIGRVLGIWPDALPLDTAAEKDALPNAGLDYEALEGSAATRMGVIEQLSQFNYKVLEIGAKGGAEGVKLFDGITPPRWWAELAKRHHIDLFVILANESSKPGVENVADAIFNAGAKAVVSVDSKIDDIDAVRFARVLYRRLARKIPLADAVGYARLVITDAGADTIKLRER